MGLVKVYVARDASEAHFLKMLLEREGMPATVLGDKLALALGGIPFTRGTLPAVWVPEEAKEAAQAVIERFGQGGERIERLSESPWICPNCGEEIEPQFTDCWNCGAAQSGTGKADASPEPRRRLHDRDAISLDLACLQCGYNLRGLDPPARCPECGAPTGPSLVAILRSASPEQQEEIQQLFAPVVERVSEVAGAPSAAVLPLLEAWAAALAEDRPAQADGGATDAILLCREVALRLAPDFANEEEMLATLDRWNLGDCQKLGRMLDALIEQGVLDSTDRVRLEQFPVVPIARILYD